MYKALQGYLLSGAAVLLTLLMMLALSVESTFGSTEADRLNMESYSSERLRSGESNTGFFAPAPSCFSVNPSTEHLMNFPTNRANFDPDRFFKATKIIPSGVTLGKDRIDACTVETSKSTEIQITFAGVVISYCSKDNSLSVIYKGQDKQYEMQLMAEERMGLLIEANSEEFTYSLRFLEEDQKWPAEELVEKKNITSKSVTKLPGWVICIVVRENEYGE